MLKKILFLALIFTPPAIAMWEEETVLCEWQDVPAGKLYKLNPESKIFEEFSGPRNGETMKQGDVFKLVTSRSIGPKPRGKGFRPGYTPKTTMIVKEKIYNISKEKKGSIEHMISGNQVKYLEEANDITGKLNIGPVFPKYKVYNWLETMAVSDWGTAHRTEWRKGVSYKNLFFSYYEDFYSLLKGQKNFQHSLSEAISGTISGASSSVALLFKQMSEETGQFTEASIAQFKAFCEKDDLKERFKKFFAEKELNKPLDALAEEERRVFPRRGDPSALNKALKALYRSFSDQGFLFYNQSLSFLEEKVDKVFENILEIDPLKKQKREKVKKKLDELKDDLYRFWLEERPINLLEFILALDPEEKAEFLEKEGLSGPVENRANVLFSKNKDYFCFLEKWEEPKRISIFMEGLEEKLNKVEDKDLRNQVRNLALSFIKSVGLRQQEVIKAIKRHDESPRESADRQSCYYRIDQMLKMLEEEMDQETGKFTKDLTLSAQETFSWALDEFKDGILENIRKAGWLGKKEIKGNEWMTLDKPSSLTRETLENLEKAFGVPLEENLPSKEKREDLLPQESSMRETLPSQGLGARALFEMKDSSKEPEEAWLLRRVGDLNLN